MRKEPAKPELINKILQELSKHPEGVWIRKLARNIKEPLATVYKYVIREDYCGKYITMEKRDNELGGHLMIKRKGE
ncbi:MAG: hypothetical protein ABIH52_00775 [Candidatus Aenigmatarchaeota archaeon]